jgi:hypothetical protein
MKLQLRVLGRGSLILCLVRSYSHAMSKPDYTLSFATDAHGDHLMTNAWGGRQLSERTLDPGARLVHHVKLYGWTPEWIEKHGLKA